MNVLFIGVDDSKELEIIMQDTYHEELQFYYTESIEDAQRCIQEESIELFVCDLKYRDSEVKRLIGSLGDFTLSRTRGIFIYHKIEDFIAIYGLNSCIILYYIIRPYSRNDIENMWVNYDLHKPNIV